MTKQKNSNPLNEISQINRPENVLTRSGPSTSQFFCGEGVSQGQLVLVDDYDQAVAMVREDKAQAMVADLPICQLTGLSSRDAGLVALQEPLSWERSGIAIPPMTFCWSTGPELPQHHREGRVAGKWWSSGGSRITRG